MQRLSIQNALWPSKKFTKSLLDSEYLAWRMHTGQTVVEGDRQPCYATERCLPPVCARCVRLPESNGNTLQLLKGFRWFQVEKPRILRQCGPSKIGTFMAEPKLHSSEASGSLEFIRIRVSSHTSCCPHCFTMFHHVSPCFTHSHGMCHTLQANMSSQEPARPMGHGCDATRLTEWIRTPALHDLVDLMIWHLTISDP